MADNDNDDQDPIPFIPVPSRTNRRDGWTEARQRAFIAALSRCGSAAASARQVGKSVRGAYALMERPGAESFIAAWDLAVAMGRDATRDNVIDRAMHGAWVPVVRRGRTVRMEFRYFDRLAIALLSGRNDAAHISEDQARRAQIRAWRREGEEAARHRAEMGRLKREAWAAVGRRIDQQMKARASRRRRRG